MMKYLNLFCPYFGQNKITNFKSGIGKERISEKKEVIFNHLQADVTLDQPSITVRLPISLELWKVLPYADPSLTVLDSEITSKPATFLLDFL